MNKKSIIHVQKNEVFSSKADVLDFLNSKIKKSEIEELFYFTIKEWKREPEKIIKEISKLFQKKIIIRSSAIGEDSIFNSQAGSYDSVLNINPRNKISIKQAITKVISSYEKKKNFLINNKILIQQQSQNIVTSGVVLTRVPESGAPYFVINYDDTKATDTVTKGTANNTIKIYKKIKKEKMPEKWRKLVSSILELELILKIDSLDIEFGIKNNGNVVIFQVRPITSIQNKIFHDIDRKVKEKIEKNKKRITKLKKSNKPIRKIFFSDMADWNPSEIIGKNPNQLDYSLYKYLIMDNAWYKGRTDIGYNKPYVKNLMVKFGNKPYVNAVASFSSFFPKHINQKLEKKLIKFYLKELSENQHLHDKIEFELIFSCFDLSTKYKLKKLKKYGFSEKEIKYFEYELKKLTNNIFEKFPYYEIEFKKSLEKLVNRRKILKKNLSKTNKNHSDLLNTSKLLLEDCKKLGTIPFSSMARIAFISSIIMKSLVSNKILKYSEYEHIMESIESPLVQFRKDFDLYTRKKISYKKLMEMYGHLRPGTYDITAPRYDKERFFDKYKFKETNRKKVKKVDYLKIENTLRKNGLKIEKNTFLDFVKKSISQREEIKFEFSKNLSDALELIAITGENLGFKKEEISNLDIKTIINSRNKKKNEIKDIWIKEIKKQQQEKQENGYIQFPAILNSINDLEIIQYHIAKPNFVTKKSVTSELKFVKKLNHDDLTDKIVLIENADPGYDWIFTRNPSGLITKYGGVASHMAIRCTEIGLPAAIGCGEMLFENLTKSKKITLDCKNGEIAILENEEIDETLEAKKTLQFLGYIK